MKLELKNITVNQSRSQETTNFAATLYVDGDRFATISNEGTGGADIARPVGKIVGAAFYQKLKEIDAWLVANEPKVDMSKYGTKDMDCDLELWCGEQIERHIATKTVKRLTAKKIVMIKDGKWLSFSIDPTETNITRLKQVHPTGIVINDLPLEEQIARFRTVTG